MSDQCIIFSPECNQWTLADGRHHMEVPEWAREIMRGEFERETRPLRDNLDLALDSKRIAERRVTELLDENAKLRDENQSIGMAAYELGRKSMAAENAKLRELVADMWREGMCECGSLGKCATCMYEYPTRMRELGVEVDG